MDVSEEEYEIREGLLYTSTHEWAKLEGGLMVMGITDYAQRMLHEIVFVELPRRDAEVTKGEAFMSVESVKAVSDVYAPVSGRVVEVNGDLETFPERVNESPYEKGWMAKIEPSAWEEESKGLLGAEAYRKVIEEESA
ncbi:MAG: glycine cleavage system protein GcvH [Candidatus Geothermarchaeales archaeon]